MLIHFFILFFLALINIQDNNNETKIQFIHERIENNMVRKPNTNQEACKLRFCLKKQQMTTLGN